VAKVAADVHEAAAFGGARVEAAKAVEVIVVTCDVAVVAGDGNVEATDDVQVVAVDAAHAQASLLLLQLAAAVVAG